MAGLSIANPVATLNGIEFDGTLGDIAQRFLLHREALEDLDYKILETGPEMMEAFKRHRSLIAEVAGKVIQEGRGGPRTILLQSLL